MPSRKKVCWQEYRGREHMSTPAAFSPWYFGSRIVQISFDDREEQEVDSPTLTSD